MDPSLYTSLNVSSYLLCPAGGLGLLPRHSQYKFIYQTPSSFPNPKRPEPWMLFQCNQPEGHHISVGGPWGPPVA